MSPFIFYEQHPFFPLGSGHVLFGRSFHGLGIPARASRSLPRHQAGEHHAGQRRPHKTDRLWPCKGRGLSFLDH